MTLIPPVDLKLQHSLIENEVNSAVSEVLASGRYIGGTTVTDFEQQFADYIGVSEAVSCNSGTDALYLALRSLNIGVGDEVITTTFTFIATSEVIIRVGATPVFVDIDPKTLNLDLDQLESVITPQTKAIIPVHLFGQPVDMTRLMAIAAKYHLYVIEDCAQATGAEWNRQKVGNIGHIGCFSFFPTKNLGACGDGGMITTNNPKLASSMRMLKEHGSNIRYRHDLTGINSRLDAIQAVILQIKLRYLEQWNTQRTEVAKRYDQLLQTLSDLILPQVTSGGKHVWNQYTIQIRKEKHSCELYRETIRQELQQMGVISMVYYPIPLHLQPVYQNLGYKKGQLPIAEKICDQVLSLPMFPDLNFAQQEKVFDCLHQILDQD
jgi:dTDP-4-amino-4,6-dideoxygalactose transaminase